MKTNCCLILSVLVLLISCCLLVSCGSENTSEPTALTSMKDTPSLPPVSEEPIPNETPADNPTLNPSPSPKPTITPEPTSLVTDTPEPSPTPSQTPTSEPPTNQSSIIGTGWTYDVNYEFDKTYANGYQRSISNDTSWATTVTGTEVVNGVLCYRTESTVVGYAQRCYNYPGDRGIQPMEFNVTLAKTGTGPIVHRSMEHGNIVREVFPLELEDVMCCVQFDIVRNNFYHHYPPELNVDSSYSFDSVIHSERSASGPMALDWENSSFGDETTWTAQVTSIEEVIVPKGSYLCYKIEVMGTGGTNPDSTNYYWWAVDEDFPCPVKYQHNYLYMGSETYVLSSYTPG